MGHFSCSWLRSPSLSSEVSLQTRLLTHDIEACALPDIGQELTALAAVVVAIFFHLLNTIADIPLKQHGQTDRQKATQIVHRR